MPTPSGGRITWRIALAAMVLMEKGGVSQMRAVPGYVTVDLTGLAENNGGQFPRQQVYDAIDGRKRFPAHFIGDMPAWRLKYQPDNRGTEGEEKVRRRILALVDYIESLQAKRIEK